MSLSPEADDLRDKYYRFLLDTVEPLRRGPDPEVALEALLEAVSQLRSTLRAELAELRLAEVE